MAKKKSKSTSERKAKRGKQPSTKGSVKKKRSKQSTTKKSSKKTTVKKTTAKKKATKKKATKKKTTKKKAVKKKTTKKKSKRKSSKKTSSTRRTRKSKSTKKKSTKKSSVKRKPARKKTTRKKSPNVSGASSRRAGPRRESNQAPSDSNAAPGVPPNFVVTGTAETDEPVRLLSGPQVRAEIREREKVLEKQYAKAEKELGKIRADLLSGDYGHVTGLAISFRSMFGQTVSPLEFVIEVHVPSLTEHFRRPGLFKPIPLEIKGVRIQIIETLPVFPEPPEPRPKAMMERTGDQPRSLDREPPPQHEMPPDGRIRGGLPIADRTTPDNWGTFGIRVPVGQEFVGLCNAHFADTDARMVQPVLDQPGTDQEFGRVIDAKYKVTPDGDFKIDAALIDLSADKEFANGVLGFGGSSEGPEIFFANRHMAFRDRDTIIEKRGASIKDVRQGKLKRWNFDDAFINGRLFKDLIYIESENFFIESGDSGSVGLVRIDRNGQTAFVVVALIFAKIDDRTALPVTSRMLSTHSVCKFHRIGLLPRGSQWSRGC